MALRPTFNWTKVNKQMALFSRSDGSVLCDTLGLHTYRYDRLRLGDVYATEKVCMRCGETKLENPAPRANPQ